MLPIVSFMEFVTAAILVLQNIETAAMLVYQDNPVGIDLSSLYVLFSQYRSRDNTLGNRFFHILSYSRASRYAYRKITPSHSHATLFLHNTTVNDLINARGVNLILGVQVGAFNRWEAFKRERRLFS